MADHSAHMDHSGHASMHNMGSNSVTDGVHSHAAVGDSGHEHMDNMEGMHMSMFFHFGFNETILFKGWQISSVGGLVGSMIGIFLIALFYEGIKYFREFLFKKMLTANYSATSNKMPVSEENRPVQYLDQVLLPTPVKIYSPSHLLQTGLHMIQFVVSYFLMLVFMTYNVWLCLACVLGSGTGYFLFGWRKSVVVDVTEHCH